MNIDYLQPLALHKLTTWLWHSAHLRKFWKIFSQFLILLDNHPRSLQIFGDLEMIFDNLHMILRTWKGMFQVIFLIIWKGLGDLWKCLENVSLSSHDPPGELTVLSLLFFALVVHLFCPSVTQWICPSHLLSLRPDLVVTKSHV